MNETDIKFNFRLRSWLTQEINSWEPFSFPLLLAQRCSSAGKFYILFLASPFKLLSELSLLRRSFSFAVFHSLSSLRFRIFLNHSHSRRFSPSRTCSNSCEGFREIFFPGKYEIHRPGPSPQLMLFIFAFLFLASSAHLFPVHAK